MSNPNLVGQNRFLLTKQHGQLTPGSMSIWDNCAHGSVSLGAEPHFDITDWAAKSLANADYRVTMPRSLFASVFCSVGILLGLWSFAANPAKQIANSTSTNAATAGNWSIVDSPNADVTRQNELDGVMCVSASDCWAVGDYYTPANAYQTLIEHWDGTSWTIVPSANRFDPDKSSF